MAAASTVFKVDPYVSDLAAGRRPASWGLNLNLASPPPEALRKPYEDIAHELVSALKGSGAYVYPFKHLHITAASPAPFTAAKIYDPAARSRYAAFWMEALTKTCVAANGWPTCPFSVVYDSLKLETAAAFFHILDPTGGVAAVRKCIQLAASHVDELCKSESDISSTAGGFRVPGIVHTSMLRFQAALLETDLTEETVRSRFAAAAAKWEPVTVLVDNLVLVAELVPYMHLDLTADDEACMLLSLPFASPP